MSYSAQKKLRMTKFIFQALRSRRRSRGKF